MYTEGNLSNESSFELWNDYITCVTSGLEAEEAEDWGTGLIAFSFARYRPKRPNKAKQRFFR